MDPEDKADSLSTSIEMDPEDGLLDDLTDLSPSFGDTYDSSDCSSISLKDTRDLLTLVMFDSPPSFLGDTDTDSTKSLPSF